MSQESVAQRARRVIASRYKDHVAGITIDEHDEELMSAAGRGAHNVNRECIPWALGLYGTGCFQTVPIIAPQLTLWAALSDLYAEAATGLVGIAVAKEFPQGLAA